MWDLKFLKPGLESMPLHWEQGVFTTGPQGKSLAYICSSLSVLSFCVLNPLRTWCSVLTGWFWKNSRQNLALVMVCRASNQRKPSSSLSSYWVPCNCRRAPQVALVGKSPPSSAGDMREVGSIAGSGRSPGAGSGSPLQYSCPGNPVDRGAWRLIVHGKRVGMILAVKISWLLGCYL